MFPSELQDTPQQATPPSLADIVREETQDGRLVVRFLVDVMQGGLDDAKPCHRLDAARQLLVLGLLEAQAFIDANAPPSQQHTVSRAGSRVLPSALHEETRRPGTGGDRQRTHRRPFPGGRHAGRPGPGFKPHHRLSAAKELLHRGFDAPAPACRHQQDQGNRSAHGQPAVFQPAESPASIAAAAIRARRGRYADYPPGYNRYKMEPGPFTFETYDDEDFHFDCFGAYAKKYILGGEDAARAATMAVIDFRSRVHPDLGHMDPSLEDDPELVPDEAPLPEEIYGFKALLRIYGTEAAARVAAMGAAQYHREQAARAGKYPGLPPRSDIPEPEWDEPCYEDLPEDILKSAPESPSTLRPPAPGRDLTLAEELDANPRYARILGRERWPLLLGPPPPPPRASGGDPGGGPEPPRTLGLATRQTPRQALGLTPAHPRLSARRQNPGPFLHRPTFPHTCPWIPRPSLVFPPRTRSGAWTQPPRPSPQSDVKIE